jgi:hypothetical protein
LKKLCTWFILNVHFRFTHLLLSCLNREREGWLIARFFLFALLKVQNGMFFFMMVMPCSTLNWKLLLQIIYIYIFFGVLCVEQQFFDGYGYRGTSFEQTYRCYPASFIEKVGIFFSPSVGSVHWYDFEVFNRRMAVIVCLLIGIVLSFGLWGFKFYGNCLLIGKKALFLVLQRTM